MDKIYISVSPWNNPNNRVNYHRSITLCLSTIQRTSRKRTNAKHFKLLNTKSGRVKPFTGTSTQGFRWIIEKRNFQSELSFFTCTMEIHFSWSEVIVQVILFYQNQQHWHMRYSSCRIQCIKIILFFFIINSWFICLNVVKYVNTI